MVYMCVVAMRYSRLWQWRQLTTSQQTRSQVFGKQRLTVAQRLSLCCSNIRLQPFTTSTRLHPSLIFLLYGRVEERSPTGTTSLPRSEHIVSHA
ncbi:hypothetical protein J6590_033363 [Homalodisca vitripennis]|nr:hypothetical protein J6590_033363 [Homalodisca vitripennis]